jgi:hypothetical protein
MARKQKLDPVIQLAGGIEGKRRFRTDYWMDGRTKKPSAHARSGFPRTEDGSIEGAGKIIMKGWCSKIGCYDRKRGVYVWTLVRGDKVPGTHLYSFTILKGDAEAPVVRKPALRSVK